jgi:hypothetical protein
VAAAGTGLFALARVRRHARLLHEELATP